MKNLLHATFHAIFWLCNITFLLVICVGFWPEQGSEIVKAASNSSSERESLITLAVLTVISIICTVLGLRRFRKQPLQLIRLFYGVEAPLFILSLLFFFLRQWFRLRLPELTPASALILGTVGVCIVAFYLEVLYGYAKRHQAIAWLQMMAHSLMPGVGVYLGLLLLFYAAPAAVFIIYNFFFQFQWVRHFWYIWISENWWTPVSFMLFCVSVVLSLFMPWILTSYYIQSGQRILRAFAAQYGRNRTVIGSGAVVTAWMILCISFNAQPQIQAFKLLENPAPSDSEKAALVAKSDLIRDGLLNAYFSSYRYLSPSEESFYIRTIYEGTFGLPKPFSQFLQDTYNQLMSPFLYNGSRQDRQTAEKLYAQFFDTPLQKAERQAIQHALQSTGNLDDAKAGLLNINQEKVWLRSQQVTVKSQGDWADVELYEVYANQTDDVEEIFYSFSLPESAAITGVWLGDSENLDKRFPFKVSPRGAAQKVYTSQVNRWRPVDPALLEQVGPLQYRLRAFPIPRRLSPQEQAESENELTEMHLWLTYKVMRQEKGWALPQLGEKRNIFWNEDTQRIRNGEVVARFSDDYWLEPFLPSAEPYQPSVHQVNLPNGYQILAKPLAAKDYLMPQGKRFAVILDASRSMAAHTKELSETLSWMNQHGFADNIFANNDADLYISASPGAKPKRIDDLSSFDAKKMTFYGSIQPKEMLRQFTQLRGDTSYDGILLVTDESSYELSDNRKDVPVMPAPLSVVHLGSLPPGYDDATLKAIQDSGGGVCTEISELLQRQATKAALGSAVINVVDGYAWFMEKAPENSQSADTTQNSNTEGFETLAVRQMVLGLSKKMDGKIAQLDAIHALAKTYKIVTPYSSMIVLVNDEQREALKIAEAQKDRFNRSVEDGKEQLRNNRFNVVSVPEPSTIIGLVAIALFLIRTRQRGVY